MPDASLYPVSLHHSASATFVPSAHDMTAAQHYGPSTSSSQPQPGTSGVRGRNLNFVLPLSLSVIFFSCWVTAWKKDLSQLYSRASRLVIGVGVCIWNAADCGRNLLVAISQTLFNVATVRINIAFQGHIDIKQLKVVFLCKFLSDGVKNVHDLLNDPVPKVHPVFTDTFRMYTKSQPICEYSVYFLNNL